MKKQNNVAALQMAHLESSALAATSIAAATQQSSTYRFVSCSQITRGHCCGYGRNALCELIWSLTTPKSHPVLVLIWQWQRLLFVLLLSHIPLRAGSWEGSPWIVTALTTYYCPRLTETHNPTLPSHRYSVREKFPQKLLHNIQKNSEVVQKLFPNLPTSSVVFK